MIVQQSEQSLLCQEDLGLIPTPSWPLPAIWTTRSRESNALFWPHHQMPVQQLRHQHAHAAAKSPSVLSVGELHQS